MASWASSRARATPSECPCRSPARSPRSSRIWRRDAVRWAGRTSIRWWRWPRPDATGERSMTRARLAFGMVLAVVLAAPILLGPGGPAEAQKRGGTLTIVRPTDPVSLDPQLETTAPGAWVYFNMLEPLLTMDEKMQIRPALATGYEVLSPTKVRFKLRPGVKFHDGTPLNAAAVKFTFDRALRGNPPARWASLAGSLSGAEVVDDLTVDVTTREPYGPILRTLAMYCTGIVSPTAVQKMGEGFSRAPVGTGPFKFVEWKTNTQVILDNILEGSAVPARGVLAPSVFGFKDMQLDRLYPFDRAKAKGLLAQAGWTPGPDGILQKGGQKLSLSWLAARGRYPKDGEITEAIQAMFKEVGVEAKVQFLEWATVFTQFRSASFNHQMFTLGWVTSNADADYSLYALFHSKQVPPTGWNTSRYANPKVDTLVEQARRSMNQAEREKLYGETQDILAKEMVWIPVYNTKEIVVTRAGVKGFTVHPVEYNLWLGKTWLDK